MSQRKINGRKFTVAARAALPLALLALSANAGIKYWDNPAYKAFDVGKPDGLSITIR